MKRSKIIKDGLIIAIIKSKWIFRNFLSFLTAVIFPVFISLVSIFVFHVVNLPYAFSMVVLFMTSLSTIALVSQGIVSDEQSRTLAIFVTLPIHPFSYALGIALHSLIFNSSGLIILIPLYFLLSLLTEKVPIANFILIFVASLPGWVTCLSVGFFIGIFGMKKNWVYALSSMLSVIFAFVNPLFIPIENLPVVFHYLIYLIPTTPFALIIRGIVAGSSFEYILVNLIINFVYAVIMFSLATKQVRWALG
ncbi:MAG: ABC transporter permease [Brevinematia bacterium]|jgi:hypothetical protein